MDMFSLMVFGIIRSIAAEYCSLPSTTSNDLTTSELSLYAKRCDQYRSIDGPLVCSAARYGQYYFGDYYAPRYREIGIEPWLMVPRTRGCYDPLFTYYDQS
jgi:hypothetical protein